MDDLDLDSFIANIEQTAPEENLGARLLCQECGVNLEEQEDGNYTCPNCSAQATNILQLDETELHHDEQGRPLHGQRVLLTERKSKHQIDYGWAWSTDDAVAYILSMQIDALEKARLLPEFFRQAITNMWLKFWLENIAPHIKDEYGPDELIPISTKKALKLRDVEVLVKLRDKVMIPFYQAAKHQNARSVYKMLGSSFYPMRPEDQLTHDDLDGLAGNSSSSLADGSSTSSSLGDCNPALPEGGDQIDQNNGSQPVISDTESCDTWGGNDSDQTINESDVKHKSTKNLSDESIAILTLNRTLAFIEATARCLQQNDPLFASDIIRACNQRLIPFYNAGKILPDNMKLTPHDRLMFQKTRPPTPVQLTRTACLLINKIYRDQPAKVIPVPDLSCILERFIQDTNLPYELYDLIRDEYSFADFTQTRPMILNSTTQRRLPQYDRWAFAVLLCQLKKLFNLSDIYIRQQSDLATERSCIDRQNYFDLSKWVQQLSLRLKLILRYDAFVLYHPLTEVDKLEATPQLAKYIELILEDRTASTIRLQPRAEMFDEMYRKELCEFLQHELPLPEGVDAGLLVEEELDISANIKYPISDAIDRTRRFWEHQFEKEPQINDLIFRNFSTEKLVLLDNVPGWNIYDDGVPQSRWQLKILPDWPYAFKLLLNVGAFLCFCDPVELLNEVRLVEDKFYPKARARNPRRINKNKT